MYYDLTFITCGTSIYINVSEHTTGNQKGLQSLFMMILVGH